MTLPKYLTTVTPLSKYLAMILFIVLPFVGFYLGMQYQKAVTPKATPYSTVSSKNRSVTSATNPSDIQLPTFQTISVDTTSWKQYKNTKYNYSFLYPSALHQTSFGCTGPDRTMCYDGQQFGQTNFNEGESLNVYVGKIHAWQTLNDFVTPSSGEYFRTLTKKTINNISMVFQVTKKAIAVGNNQTYPHQEVSAVFLLDETGPVYVFTYSWPAEIDTPPINADISKYYSILEKVLTSLTTKSEKIVTKNVGQADCQTNFQKYDNEYFSVCVPATMQISYELTLTEGGVKLHLSDANQEIQMRTDFISDVSYGCFDETKTTIAGFQAIKYTQYAWQYGEDCIKNKISSYTTLIYDGNQFGNVDAPFGIFYTNKNGTAPDSSIYNNILNSLKIKKS